MKHASRIPPPCTAPTAYGVAWLALLALLSACGGGGVEAPDTITGPAVAAPAATEVQSPAETSAADGTKRALAALAPNATLSSTYTALTIRAHGTLAGNVGPAMQVWKDGNLLGSVQVQSASPADYTFWVPNLQAGSRLDVVFTNQTVINAISRSLTITHLKSGTTVQLPVGPRAVFDKGDGSAAFDGLNILAAVPQLTSNGALRITWPGARAFRFTSTQASAARLLRQATFGPTTASINRVAQVGNAAWIAEQMVMPFSADYVNDTNARYALGVDYRPGGTKYDYSWPIHRFWTTAATAPDQLRKRVAWALHNSLMVSQADGLLHTHSRAFARYLDILNQHAFGNYRQLLEDLSLSPAMGLYLSHLGNPPEDPLRNRQPDENFARELMQLFSIGLVELNIDGSPKLGVNGLPIETYDNQDVMALAKVFTGYGWGFPDAQLTELNFKWGKPDYRAAVDARLDLNPMKPYPGQHSPSAKTILAGTPWAIHIPAQTPAAQARRMALDGVFRHPNTGPFVSRQLIQRLVTSAPSPAYVGRVASIFNDNGRGARGDLAAVVTAILLDTEARNDKPTANFGRLNEPVLRTTAWMRAFNATSTSGRFMAVWDLQNTGQTALNAASVFGYYRPGYRPPQTVFSTRQETAPEFQIVNQTTAAGWVNAVFVMSGGSFGWNGTAADITVSFAPLIERLADGDASGLLQELDLRLFAGRMSSELGNIILDALGTVPGSGSTSDHLRAKLAVLLAMASPEFAAQR